MKLFEEICIWETLWEDPNTAGSAIDTILDSYPNEIIFEYEGFSREWSEDRFDPNSWYGHYDVTGTHYWDSFEYGVETSQIFEDLIYSKRQINAFNQLIKSVEPTELVIRYEHLQRAYFMSTSETEDKTYDALELFVAQNLLQLVDIFEASIKQAYQEEAEKWAIDHIDPN